MKKTMNVEEIKMITSFVTDDVEIWVEVNDKKIPVYDFEFEIDEDDSRIVLKV